MEIATVVFMIVGGLLIAFAAVAVISAIRGVSHITLEEPADGSPKLGRVGTFQAKLEIANR